MYFVGFGSFSEYDVKNKSICETDHEKPNNLYGLSKNTFKLFSKNFCEVTNFKWLWIRPCYIYGPSDVKSRLIPTVIESCLKNQNLVLNSCDSIIDYLYIQDFVEAVHCLIDNKSNGVFNICSGKQYKIKDLVHKIHSLCDSDTQINFDSSKDRDNFSKFICGKNDKLINSTNWAQRYDIDAGLKETIKYFEKILRDEAEYNEDYFTNCMSRH